MEDSSGKKFQKDLNGGLVGLVLLTILNQSTEDLYGYEIAKRLANANEDVLTGALRVAWQLRVEKNKKSPAKKSSSKKTVVTKRSSPRKP